MPKAKLSLRHVLAASLTIILGAAILWTTMTPQQLPQWNDLPIDKLVHLAAFAALILPTAWGYPQALVVTLPLAIGLGGAIELLQPLVGRGRELADFVMDVAGVGVGLVIGTGLRRAVF